MINPNMLFKDKIMAGGILGLVSNFPKLILDIILYYSGFSDFFCWHVTGGILVSQEWLTSVHGLLLGSFMDFFFAGFLGVLLVYFLYYFGERRYLIIKGFLFNIFIWVSLCIVIIDQRISMYPKLTDPWHAYQSFIDHSLWGIVMSYLVVKYAKSTITPRKYREE